MHFGFIEVAWVLRTVVPAVLELFAMAFKTSLFDLKQKSHV
jgi:hypothetical protein